MFASVKRFLLRRRFGWGLLGVEHTLVTMTASFLAALLTGVGCGYTSVMLLGEVLGVVVGVFAAQTAFLVVWLLVFSDHVVLIPLLVAAFYGSGIAVSLLFLPASHEIKTVVLSAVSVTAGILFGVWIALFMAMISLWGASVSRQQSVQNEKPGK